jgi:hypothetical protein
LEVREIWGRMSKKRNLFADPRMVDKRRRKTANFKRFWAKNIVGQMGV